MLLRTASDPAVFVPRQHLNGAREFARMSWGIKGEDGSVRAGMRSDAALPPPPPGSRGADAAIAPVVVVTAEAAGTRDSGADARRRSGRLWVPALPGLRARLAGKSKNVVVETVRCFHTLADVGFVVCEVFTEQVGVDESSQVAFDALRARAQTGDRSAGREIGTMRKRGLLRQAETLAPVLAYLCDTTTQVFGTLCAACAAGMAECAFASEFGAACEPDAAARGSQRSLLLRCACIVVECSFIGAAGMSDSEADAEAIKRGHASWTQLREHVEASPGITFVLVHFSLRYKDAEIREYFTTAGSDGRRPPNVVLWLDTGIDDPKLKLSAVEAEVAASTDGGAGGDGGDGLAAVH